MKKLQAKTIQKLILMVLIGVPSLALAQSKIDLPASFKKLHISLPSGCSIVERPESDGESGPYLRTYTCNEQDFRDIKEVTGTVYRVVDGDTIHFFYKNKVYATRMLGMDTPELHYYSNAQPVWGLKAKKTLLAMVKPGDTIRAEFDQVKCDRYGRMLVHIFKGNVNLNYEQVKNGMAVNYCIAPNMKYCSEFAAAYRAAQIAGIGIHTDRCLVTPYVWRRAMENRSMDKRVMDSTTGIIYSPSEYYRVPVANRVFLEPTGQN